MKEEIGGPTLDGLCDRGEPLRVALRGNRSLFHRFTAVDLEFFFGGFVACLVCVSCLVGCCLCFVSVSPRFEIILVVLRS